MNRWVVVLAGGVGSRFWPLSTPERPKQLLPLVNEQPMLAQTLERLRPLVEPQRTLILTNASLVNAVRAILHEVPAENVIAEPRPAGTAAALSWAASEIERRDSVDAVMMSVHADWAIADENGFRATLAAAERVAYTERCLVTVGVVPTRADTGFGYIQPGEPMGGFASAFRVARFVEKPDRTRAEWMRHEGYLWNSGIFVWRVGDFLQEVRAVTPEISGALDRFAGTGADMNAFFGAVQPVSVDVGVLERSSKVAVLQGDFGWDDVGTWAALRRVIPEDEHGNVVRGRVYAQDASANVVHADGGTVVLYGVTDLVVVSTGSLTLVTTTERAENLKKLVDALPAEVREPSS